MPRGRHLDRRPARVFRGARALALGLALLLALLLPCGRSLAGPPASAAVRSLAAGSGANLLEAVRRAEYEFSPVGTGVVSAPNRAQNLRSRLSAGGLELTPRTAVPGTWRLPLRLARFGRAGDLATLPAVTPVAAGNRVEYRHAAFGLTEWYVNGPGGLEQGFTIGAAPPPSAPPRSGGARAPIVLEMEHPGEVVASLAAGASSVVFATRGGDPTVRYGGLRVWDAIGRRLGAALAVGPGTVRIRVDDAGAVYPLTVDPLFSSPDWSAEGDQSGAQFGFEAATAGDVNGDGFDDVIAGAPLFDAGEADEGRAFVFLGSASGLDPEPVWIGESDQADAQYGFAAASAGDVNGDGFDDIVVAAWRYDNGETDEGMAWLYLGSPTGPAAAPAWSGESNQASAFYGVSVNGAGDVDGDGFDDVVVGAFFWDNEDHKEGKAYLYLGSAAGLSPSADWTQEGDQTEAEFGRAVASAGDVDGDGFDDVVVGAHMFDGSLIDEGRVFLYRGGAGGLSATADWFGGGGQAGALFGIALASAGDVDGDGYDDVVIGASEYDNAAVDAGRALVYMGSPSGLEETPAWTAEVSQAARLGFSVGGAGDVNGDTYSDIIVGAPLYDNDLTDEGAAFIYLGSPGGLAAEPYWSAEGDQVTARLGIAVGAAGDVNNDTYSDIIAGAGGYTGGQSGEGRAVVYHGGPPPPLVINEVAYMPDPTSTEPLKTHQWVEIFNAGADPVDVGGWVLAGRDAGNIATLPAWVLPDSAYLVVHWTTGTNDSDFSDGEGDFYAGAAIPLSAAMDECALYVGAPAAVRMVDFVAWSDDSNYVAGLAHDQAVAAALWSAGDFFSTEGAADPPGFKGTIVIEGTSIGRDQDARDTNSSADWDTDGGRDAYDITPGARNLSDDLGFPPWTPLAPQPQKKWTVMVYGSADNDLELDIFRDMNSIEWVGSNADMNLLLQFDARRARDNNGRVLSHILEWPGVESTRGHTWRGYVRKEQADLKRLFLFGPAAGGAGHLGERNMGDPAELTEFIDWSMDNYPADHYALILNGHAGGWKGYGPDETDADRLDINELSTALAAALAPNQKLDIVGFDACLMATVEVAYQLEPYARILVASQETVKRAGWPYAHLLTRLEQNPNLLPDQFAEKMVDEYHAFYNVVPPGKTRKRDPNHTLSAIDLGANFVNLVTVRIDAFAGDLAAGVEDVVAHGNPADNVQLQIREQMVAAEAFGDLNNIDLFDFALNVQLDGGIPAAYKAQAGPIVNALALNAGIVLANEVGADFLGDNNDGANGLSIYFPTAQTKVPSWDENPASPVPPVLKDEARCQSRAPQGGNGQGSWANCEAPLDDPENTFEPDADHPRVASVFKYGADPDDCTPVWGCGNPVNPNHPLPPANGFFFTQDTDWDEFLYRYYEPAGDAGADVLVQTGQPVTLDCSGSSDADGVVQKCYWDFDPLVDAPPPANCANDDWDRDCVDETDDDKDAEGANLQHVFAEGAHTVTLSVWDDHNLLHGPPQEHFETDQDAVLVTVQPAGAVGPAEAGVERVTAVKTTGASPFQARAPLSFSLAERGRVSLKIFDASGRLVRTLVDGVREPGWQDVVWDGRNRQRQRVTCGVYFVRMAAGDFRRTLKLLMIR